MNTYNKEEKDVNTNMITQIENRRCQMKHIDFFYDQLEREWFLLSKNWIKIIISFVITVIIHSICTNIIYFYHVQSPPLSDLGYMIIPKLPNNSSLSSLPDKIIMIILITTIGFMASPLFINRSKFNKNHSIFATVMLVRFGICVSICVLLRILSFLSTALPAPAPHCSITSHTYNPPKTLFEILFRFDPFYGCGDLIFSSHVLLAINLSLVVQQYSTNLLYKIFIWILTSLLIILIIAGRKHYTVDVLIACYVSPLVWNNVLMFGDSEYPVLKKDISNLNDNLV